MDWNNKADEKRKNLTEAVRAANLIKFKGKKVVFTNGCFDVLHQGHVDYLNKTRGLGDYLIVGLNNDASVKRQGKGDDRPINNEKARATVLCSLACVDAVILFDEETPLKLIEAIQPDILVKGGDYTVQTIVGADIVLKSGGKVEIIPLTEGYSTTAILEKIKKG
jgi:rfaE bifunctional protein nucleotidyltransferase chain/domain